MNKTVGAITAKRDWLTIVLRSSGNSVRNPELVKSLIRTIRYFDLFDFPLKADELMTQLYKYDKPTHIKEVEGILKELVSIGILEEIKDYYVKKGRAGILEVRKAHKFISEKLWNRTKLYGSYMRSVPFVEMIAVCNNLAYNNASDQSDIDLFIVVKPGRMWMARLFLTALLHFHGVRRHGSHTVGRFCLSFFITSNSLNLEKLQIKPEDPYLAFWMIQLKPIYGEAVYRRFKSENEPWLKNYGLHFQKEESLAFDSGKAPRVKTALEWILGGRFGDAIENFLKNTLKRKTLSSMKELGPKSSVIVNDSMLKFHNNDRRQEYYEKWNG
jgi:hypothetical protein